MTKIFYLLIFTVLIVACGKDGGGGSNKGSQGAGIQEQTSEGSYRAILRPMNNSLSGFLPTGFAEIKVVGDNLEVKTMLDDDARVIHIQSIHAGTACPNMGNDGNGDGVVDPIEATEASGPVFIPLDSDLNSESAGSGIYQMGGGYTYLKRASLAAVEADVRARMGQNLNLGGRVVMIHGVAAGTKMPATAASLQGFSPQGSVPIACGILNRI